MCVLYIYIKLYHTLGPCWLSILYTSSVYMLIPYLQFIPPLPLFFGSCKFFFFFCLWVCFWFVNKLICIIFLDCIYKQYHKIFDFLWLTSLSLILSRSLHVIANGIISLILWLSNIPLCIYIHAPHQDSLLKCPIR